MSLMGHLVMSITLLSSKRYIAEMCVDWEEGDPPESELNAANVQVITAFSLMISFLAIELFGFFSGASMFSAPQSFFSFISHSLACIGLGTFVIDRWDCTLMWLVFIFFSVLPTISEVVIFVGVYVLKRPLWPKVLHSGILLIYPSWMTWVSIKGIVYSERISPQGWVTGTSQKTGVAE